MKFKFYHLLPIAAVSSILSIQGCAILGVKTETTCSGKLDSIKSNVTTLAGFGDSYFELATPTTGATSDSAILSSACPATFNLFYRFQNQKIQSNRDTRVSGTNPATIKAAIALTHYEDGFHVNTELITFTATPVVGLVYYFADDTVKSFFIALKDHGDYPGSGSRGKFFIKTDLKGLSLDPDSTVIMQGKILYYH